MPRPCAAIKRGCVRKGDTASHVTPAGCQGCVASTLAGKRSALVAAGDALRQGQSRNPGRRAHRPPPERAERLGVRLPSAAFTDQPSDHPKHPIIRPTGR
jgi:hypothetical protein